MSDYGSKNFGGGFNTYYPDANGEIKYARPSKITRWTPEKIKRTGPSVITRSRTEHSLAQEIPKSEAQESA